MTPDAGTRFAPPLPVHARPELLAVLLIGGFLISAMLAGGASRHDVYSHIVLRPVAAGFIVAALLFIDRAEVRAVQVPLAALMALAGLIAAQLVPLPPAIWTNLPGRDLFAGGAQILGIEQPWRPISLAPARTWNSLVSLLPPFAALLLVAMVRPAQQRVLLWMLVALIGASAMLGLLQRLGPEGGPLYIYRITNEGSAVGFFANRNHQAVVLACLFPILATIAALAEGKRRAMEHRLVALGAALFLVPLLLANGSRAGLVLGLLGVLLSVPLLFAGRGEALGGLRRWALVGAAIVLAVGGAAAFWLVGSSGGGAVERLAEAELGEELRVRLLPILIGMAQQHGLVGIGFGAFDPVFRTIEPEAMLATAYVNHAHNDLLQLVIEGGAPATILTIAMLGWCAVQAWPAWARLRSSADRGHAARLGTVIAALLLLSSLVDYPLRTPFGMTLLALAIGWIASGARATPRR